ncbi:PTS sugar transporter subunit IIA [Sporolactobacillus inulinus]|uniref:PTS sugar transporter subunit IIA n=1 Tax=Sporolactobacillus inulinus TaxID=2078 RepID=UPI0021CCCE9E|nr:PTS glucose transporter subunit IIA [Sporolactobacillus inulinus]
MSAAGVKCFSYTPVMNIFEMPLFIGNNSSIVWAIIGFVVAFLSALLLVLIFGFNESNTEKLFAKVTSGKKSLTEKKTAKLGLNVKDEAAASTATEEAEHPAVNVSDLNLAETVYSPVAGNPVPLSQVDDPVFSSGAMGSGVGVLPSEGTCVSPVDGEITVAFPTGHAYGIKSDNGVEVLIHIGINTVELKGKHFDPKIETGAKVKKGDLLTTFEPDKIKEAGYDPTTMVIVTNTNNYEAVVPELDQDAAMNQPLIQVYSK